MPALMSKPAEIIFAYQGFRFTLEYARQANGEHPALEFFNKLDGRWKARLIYLYKILGDIGQIQNREMFRKESGEFWAFKAFQARMLCYFRSDQRVVITHGFAKKTDKIRVQEFDRAARIKQEYEDYLGRPLERK